VAEAQARQSRNLLLLDTLACNQNVETLAHPCRGDQVFELQSHLGALLRHTAIFKGVRKLIGLADAHQKL
jgi:hypothetical protein